MTAARPIAASGRPAHVLAFAALVAIVAALPFLTPPSIAAEILIYAIFACAANLLIGYGGLHSFGQAAFFGVGGYAAGYLLVQYQLPVLVILAAGGAIAAATAVAIGGLAIRRTGIYFIMLTFAANQMLYYLAYSWRDVTGGEDGLGGIRRAMLELPGLSIPIGSGRAFYVFVAIVFLILFLALLRIVHSPFGRILVATRENPRRAASLGYPVDRVRMIAFALSGAFSGIAGALYGLLYGIMPINSIHWTSSGFVVFMVLIGGTSNMYGPVLGAAIFIWLQGILGTLWARWPLLFGVFVVVVVLYFQGGAIALFERAWALVRRRRATA